MAVSNKFGHMVISTGNKSEISVGYTTIYGDMNGGFSPLKDAYKMDVYAMSKWRNNNYNSLFLGINGPSVPVNSIEKEPSAELNLNQKDQDSLPPYEILDEILKKIIEMPYRLVINLFSKLLVEIQKYFIFMDTLILILTNILKLKLKCQHVNSGIFSLKIIGWNHSTTDIIQST